MTDGPMTTVVASFRHVLGLSMIPDLDIWRSANVLVKRHGSDAPIEAAMRADAMLKNGDLGGFTMWKRILRAVEELQRVGPVEGERVN